MKLYMYCRPESKEILEKQYLKIIPPCDFNDPFELLAQVPDSVEREDFELDMKKEGVPHYFYEKLCEIDYEKSYNQFQQELDSNPDFFYDIYKEQLPRIFRNVLRGYQDIFCKKWGIICFSETYRSILMWSHYTEKHRGFVLEFDSDKMGIKQEYLVHVVYREARFRIKPTLDIFGKENERQFQRLLQRKHKDWHYEEEIRVMGELKEKNEFDDYPFEFSPAALTGIYFGCKHEDHMSVKELCEAKGYDPRYYLMQIHDTDFTLEPLRLW